MKRKFLISTSLLTIFILSGCANIKTVKMPQEYNNTETKIAIVPVEMMGVHVAQTPGLELLFVSMGPVGYGAAVMVEETITKPKREILKESVHKSVEGWRPETLLRNKLSEELARRGKKVIQFEMIPVPDKFRDKLDPSMGWYNPDTTVFDHTNLANQCNPTAIIEAGYEGISIFGNIVDTIILIKIVDPRTGTVIARKRATGVKLAKIKSDPAQQEAYVSEFRANFENAVAEELPEILNKMGL